MSAGHRGPLRIWFNRTYATNAHIVAMLRDNPSGRAVHVLGSHADPSSPVLAACDEAYPEPAVDDPDAYTDWALDFARRHRVDVFIPRLQLAGVADARDRFTEAGTAVLAPPAAAVRLFDDKAAAYADAAGLGVPVPPYRIVHDAAGLARAHAELSDVSDRICLKPAVGVGGEGFRVLSTAPLTLAELLGPLSASQPLDRACAALADAERAGTPIPPLLVLPYLPGPEVSVDCLADTDGTLLAAIGRSKSRRSRQITDDPAAVGVAGALVGAHRISSLCNVQVRYWQGPQDPGPRPYLLEVNTRMSGGLFQTALSGLNLAWAAVQQALGEQPQLPTPRFGARYTTVSALSGIAAARQPR